MNADHTQNREYRVFFQELEHNALSENQVVLRPLEYSPGDVSHVETLFHEVVYL